jgi:hypothetical protein
LCGRASFADSPQTFLKFNVAIRLGVFAHIDRLSLPTVRGAKAPVPDAMVPGMQGRPTEGGPEIHIRH